MKKLLNLLIIFCILIVVGCGGNDEDKKKENDGDGDKEQSTQTGLILICPNGCVYEIWNIDGFGNINSNAPAVNTTILEPGQGIAYSKMPTNSFYRIRQSSTQTMIPVRPELDFNIEPGEVMRITLEYEPF